MPAIARSIADLGVGEYEEQLAVFAYGPAGQEERVGMRWRPDFTVGGVVTPAWVGEERDTFLWHDGWPFDPEGSPFNTYWGYMYKPSGNPGAFGQGMYGWDPMAIRHADAAFAAGLVLQEEITADYWLWNPGDDAKIATVWYPIGPGDVISNVIDPTGHVGVEYNATPTRRIFESTGWKDSGVQSCPARNLFPHIYSHRGLLTNSQNFIEYVFAQWRWVAIPA